MTRLRPMRRTDWMPVWIRHWARDSALLLFSQVATVVATSLLAIILARNLGPRDWGIFAGLFGFSLAFTTIMTFGVTVWLLRELSGLWTVEEMIADEARTTAGHLVTGAALLNGVLAAVLLAATAVVALLVRFEFVLTVALLSLMGYAALTAVSGGLEAFFRSRRELRWVAIPIILEKAILLALVGVAVAIGLGVAGISIMYTIAGTTRLALNGFNILASEHVTLRYPGFSAVRTTARGAVSFALNGVALSIIPRFDTFILAVLSATAAGYYALGDRILGPAVMIPLVMSSALYPFLAREKEGSSAPWKILGAFVVGGAILAVIGTVASPIVVPVVFGAAYAPAIEVVQVMLLGLPFIYGTNAVLAHLYTRGQEQRMLVATISVSLFGTGTIVAGQLIMGPTGAAVGSVIRQVLLLAGLVMVALVTDSILREPHTRAPVEKDPRIDAAVSNEGSEWAHIR